MAMSKVQQDDSKEKLLTDIDDKVLLCSICMERFKSPKILPCFHTFCESCLTEWVKTSKGNLICPTCKQSWPLTPKGVAGVPNNGFMNDLLELMHEAGSEYNKPSACEGCDSTANYWCRDCGQFFCEECVRTHRVVRSLKDHQVVTMEEYDKKKETEHFKLLQPRFCDVHPSSQLEFYCDTCQSPVCLKCTVVKHKAPNHDVIQMEDALKKYTPSLQSHIETLGRDVQNLRKVKDKTTAFTKSLSRMETTAETKIKAAVQKIYRTAKKEEERLLGELKQTCRQKDKQILAQLEHIDVILGNSESMHSYLSHVLRYGNAVDILSARKASSDTQIQTKIGGSVLSDIDSVDELNFDLVFEESNYALPTQIGRVFTRDRAKPKRYAKVNTKETEELSLPSTSQDRALPSKKNRAMGEILVKDDEACPICLDKIKKPKTLPCKHTFCKECLTIAEKSLGPTCPKCKAAFGTITGNMPPGTMTHRVENYSLPGYFGCATIVIAYHFKSGKQGREHPNPGQRYTGASRNAYLPDNTEGREILRLLKIAFDRRLTFTIGTSVTTGLKDTVVWNDIHHKTSVAGGAQGYGYPDSDYLRRVKEELVAKGVK
ncbi:E3 ubiquitin-protein ligase TRIM56-like [Glandiceps talaboti]